MSKDAIVLLRDDHKKVRKLFREFQAAGDRAVKKKGRLVSQIITELTVHTYVENEVMYPEVRKLLPDLDDDVLESYEEHHVADVLCAELHALPPEDEHFSAKAMVLIELVSHHMAEEEQDWFPKVRDGLKRKQLQELGARIEKAKKRAPSSPPEPSALKKSVDAILA
jgi:hemerythrin superfamily protein